MAYVGIGPNGGKVYTTGAKRRITWSGNISGSSGVTTTYIASDAPPGGTSQYGAWLLKIPVGLPITQFGVNQVTAPTIYGYCGAPFGIHPSGSTYTLNATSGFGSADTQTKTINPNGTDFTLDMAGSWTYALDVEECIEVVTPGPGAYVTSHGTDPIIGRWYRKFERPRAGGIASMTVASGPLTATASDVIPSGTGAEVGPVGISLYESSANAIAGPPHSVCRKLSCYSKTVIVKSDPYGIIGHNPDGTPIYGNLYPCDGEIEGNYCVSAYESTDGGVGPVTCYVSDNNGWLENLGIEQFPGPVDYTNGGVAAGNTWPDSIISSIAPKRYADIRIRAKAMNGEHPGPVKINYCPAAYTNGEDPGQAILNRIGHAATLSGPDFTQIQVQRRFSASYNGVPVSNPSYIVPAGSPCVWAKDYDPAAASTEQAGASLALSGSYQTPMYLASGSFTHDGWFDGYATLLSAGDDTFEKADPRMMIAGSTPLSVATIEHVADGPDIAGSWVGTNCAVSASGSNERIDVPNPTTNPVAVFTFTSKQEFQAYRYLQFTAESLIGSASGFAVQIGAKRWEGIVTGDAGVMGTVTIDLMAPTNQDARIDTTGTKWPLTSIAGGVEDTVDGPFWGVTAAESIQVDSMTPGESYIIGPFHLHRNKTAAIDLVPADNDGDSYPPGADAVIPTNENIYPSVVGFVDERRALEEPFQYFNVSARTTVELTLSDLINRMAARPGWTVTPSNATLGDGYHDPAVMPACSLGGGFGYWDFSLDQWVEPYGIDCTAPAAISAVDLVDFVSWYPGCGREWGPAKYGPEPFPIYITKILRMGARGIVLDNQYQPFGGAIVDTAEEKVTEDYTGAFPTYSGQTLPTILQSTAADDGSYIDPAPMPYGETYPQVFAGQIGPVKTQAYVYLDDDVPPAGVFVPGGLGVIEPNADTGLLSHNRRWQTIHFRSHNIKGGKCARIAVVPIDFSGVGHLIYSAGGQLMDVVRTVAITGPGTEGDTGPIIIASGYAPCAHRDATGLIHLWYTRDGDIYYRSYDGTGWGPETLSLSGYSCAGTAYSELVHRVIMVALTGSAPNQRAKAILFSMANYADFNLTPDTANTVDLGPSDNVCPAVEVMSDGSIKAWISSGGNIGSMVSFDGGSTWAAG